MLLINSEKTLLSSATANPFPALMANTAHTNGRHDKRLYRLSWWVLGLGLTTLILWLPAPHWRLDRPTLQPSLRLAVLRESKRKNPTAFKPASPKAQALAKKQATPQPLAQLQNLQTSPSWETVTPVATNLTAKNPPQASKQKTVNPAAKAATKPAVSPRQLAAVLANATEFTVDVSVPAEFQARSAQTPAYHTPALLARDWSGPIPGIDMTADQPKWEMDFYDFGWQGAAERLYEKLVPTKTYITRYGTRITCMQVALMHICSWGASEFKLSDKEQQQLDSLYSTLHNRPLWNEPVKPEANHPIRTIPSNDMNSPVKVGNSPRKISKKTSAGPYRYSSSVTETHD